MNRLIKTILIISIAVFGAGLFVQPAYAAGLGVEFKNGADKPLFNETNFLPGGEITSWVKVTNTSGATQRIVTQPLDITDPNHLGDVLNLVIKEGEEELYNNALSNFLANGEVYLSDLANGANAQYDFTVSFDSGTQNTFQGKSLKFNILIGFQGTEGGISPGAGSSSGGGGGGWLPPGLTIQNGTVPTVTKTSVTINWLTSYAATSQVIYAKDGESHTLCLTQTEGCALVVLGDPPPPKYGYAHTTLESDTSTKVTNHLVTISPLDPNTTYYYRTVSHGSLAISEEQSFTTLTPGGEVAGTATKREEKTGSLAQGGRGIVGGASAETGGKELSPSPTPEEQAGPAAAHSLFATILTLGTNKTWLGVLVVVVVLALVAYIATRSARRKKGKVE